MQINYGLIGLGGIARTHLQAISCMPVLSPPVPPLNLAALLTTDPGKTDFGHKLGFKHVEQDLDRFLGLPELDVVDICTPNRLHKEQVIAVAKAGKHIYYEKPLTADGQEAAALEQELVGTEQLLQGAFVLRFLPAVARARTLIAQGLLGRIHSFRFQLYHAGYLNPARPGSWRLQAEMSGGGALMDLGCHLLDLVRFMLAEAESVQAWTETVVKERKWPQGMEKVDVDDHALVVLGLKNGSRGTVEVSRVAVGGEGLRLEIYGSNGAVHITPDKPVPHCYDVSGREFIPEGEADEFERHLQPLVPPAKLSMGWMLDSHFASLAWFLRSVQTGSAPVGTPDLAEGVKTQLLVQAAYDSAKKT
ncbi:MAG: Gfo/Idh/MocA family oxidoreductase [Firmicutes bacterium]|nr:Gfo/Idh/MocA family oxidoreductase [Bacillota bacterium]